jgi:methylated-DNA-[protein]-cysteine S-methyltransferase
MSTNTHNAIDHALRSGPLPPAQESAAAEAAAERLLARISADGLADIVYGSVESPFGTLHAALTHRGLVRLSFPEEGEPELVAELARRLSPRVVRGANVLDPLRRELDEYFEGRRRRFELELDWTLISPFARRVLRRTAAIPYGSHSSYGEIATKAGSPRGARAAGNALGSNPIPIVIPCHRVLHAGGGLGGYGGGLERKRWLLELEGAIPATLT